MKVFSTLDAPRTAADNKNCYVCYHLKYMIKYSLMIAHELTLDTTIQQDVAIVALSHVVDMVRLPSVPKIEALRLPRPARA